MYNYLPLTTPLSELRVQILNALQTGALEFPIDKNFTALKRSDIQHASRKFGGWFAIKERLKIPQKVKPPNYWLDWDNFFSEIVSFLKSYHSLPASMDSKDVIEALQQGRIEFPSVRVLRMDKNHDLKIIKKGFRIYDATRNFGGTNAVWDRLGVGHVKSPHYWENWDNFLKELIPFIREFNHIDPQKQLTQDEILDGLKSGQLQFPILRDFPTGKISQTIRTAFHNFGGVAAVKKKLEIPTTTKPPGYWQDWNNIKPLLDDIIKKLGYYPSKSDFDMLGQYDLYDALRRFGPIKARLAMGYDLEDQLDRIARSAYYSARGRKTEDLVVDLFKEWADSNGFTYMTQTPLGSGVLEFVCGGDKKYGVDVSNAKNLNSIREKWQMRDYHRHLDQLWIVVVANHSPEVFKKLNDEAPKNVLVVNYRELVLFLNGINVGTIPFSIPPEKQRKLDALAKCTYSNREQIMKQFKGEKKQKKISEFIE